MSKIVGPYGAAELRDLRVGRWWLLAAVVAFGAFGLLAVLVQVHSLDRLSERATTVLQSRANVGQDVLLTALGYLGTLEVTMLLAGALTLALWKGLRLLALLPVVAMGLMVTLEWVLKHLVHSQPPPQALSRVPKFMPHLLLEGHAPYSYPSGHLIRSAFLYGLVLYLATRWRLFGKDGATLAPVLLFLIFFIGYGRIYLGEHWLTDVVGGVLLAAAGLLLAIGYLERKRTLPPPVRRYR
jgi:undecaprenyl-diphosphatase